MEEEIVAVTDDSRPFYQRKEGRIGLYIEIYEARAERPKEFGSNQFFLMSLKEKMEEYLKKVDLVKLKGFLETKKVFKGVILEKFEMGLILTLAFDDVEALEGLWKLHTGEKLNCLVQEMVVEERMLREVGARHATLQTKLWEDEYKICRSELTSASTERISIKKTCNGVAMIKRLRESQKTLLNITTELRDRETELDRNLPELIVAVKKIIPTNVLSINTLKEFQTSVKVAQGTKDFKPNIFEHINHYFQTLERLREAVVDVEQIIWHPLVQIHAACENAKQRTAKRAIRDTLDEVVGLLKPEHDLQKVLHKDWEIKILFRERRLFLGLVSLVPVSLEKILDVDSLVDEYITDFPDKFKF